MDKSVNRLRKLLLQLVHGSGDVRASAQNELKRMLTENEMTLDDLVSSTDPRVRRAVVAAVELSASESVRKNILKAALGDADPIILSEACWAMEESLVQDIDIWDRLVELLKHSDWHVRQAALAASGNWIADDSDKVYIIAHCIDDTEWRVRDALAATLAKAGKWDSLVMGLFERLLTDSVPAVRKSAVIGLKSFGLDGQSLKAPVARLLSDESWDVRIKACEALEIYGRGAAFAVSDLEKNANVSDIELSQAARKALLRIKE